MKIRYLFTLVCLITLQSLNCSTATTALENAPVSIQDLINEGFDFENRVQGLAWDLSGLGLTSLEGLEKIEKLEKLTIKQPDGSLAPITNNQRVFFINLNNNNLTSLDELINFPELLIIYAANNNLSNDMSLDFSKALENLNTLDVSGNNLSNRTIINIRSKKRKLNVINKNARTE